MVLTIDTMIDGDDSRHGGRGYKSSGDGGTSLLPGNPLFHQPNIAFLLLVSTMLGAKGSLQNVVQLDLVSNTILHVQRAKAMYFGSHARVV